MPEQDQGTEQPRGIADKACWTEPLVARAKLASSMGIVKRNAGATKLVRMHQASRMNMNAGIGLSAGEFRACDSEAEAAKVFGRGRTSESGADWDRDSRLRAARAR